tara:strand:+ start:1649 stop:2344 length:696 start_codon:yes stop_codon:yes gene_type:complete
MEGKKSFILYSDVKTTVDLLTDEQAGTVFKWIVDYVNDLEPQDPTDPLVKMALAPIKAQLKRDLDKWQGIREKRSEAGKKSAAKRSEQKEQPLTIVESEQQKQHLPTVNDNEIVIVNENGIVIDNENENYNNNLEGRKLKFAQSLNPYLGTYKKAELKEFLEYWTEHNEKGKKLRFEMSKNQPFNLSRRLGTWHRKNTDGTINKPGSTKKRGSGVDPEYLNELNKRINGGQ